jgi:hypothetical protein
MCRGVACLVVAILCGGASSASAAIISLTGNFSIGPGVFDLGTLSLSFSGSYDDSGVPATGYFATQVSLDSLLVSPNYGSFALTNVELIVQYQDGSLATDPLVSYAMGADIDGSGPDLAAVVLGGTNDFALTAGPDGVIDNFVFARQGFNGAITEHSGVPFSGSIQSASIPVPEPMTFFLLGAGLTIAGARRCRLPARRRSQRGSPPSTVGQPPVL